MSNPAGLAQTPIRLLSLPPSRLSLLSQTFVAATAIRAPHTPPLSHNPATHATLSFFPALRSPHAHPSIYTPPMHPDLSDPGPLHRRPLPASFLASCIAEHLLCFFSVCSQKPPLL
jgi:hypothetical protein